MQDLEDARSRLTLHQKMVAMYTDVVRILTEIQELELKLGSAPNPKVVPQSSPTNGTNTADYVQFLLQVVRDRGKRGAKLPEIQAAFDRAGIVLSKNYVSNTVNRLIGVKNPQIKKTGTRMKAKIYWIEEEIAKTASDSAS